MTDAIQILGAGPAGLTAAIVLAQAGRQVEVYERRARVGARFHGDYQGLENWSTREDVLAELEHIGIEIAFPYTRFSSVRIYNPSLAYRDVRPARTLFYLIKRGSEPDTLDSALERQAVDAGVRIHYDQSLPEPQADIVATGPRGVRAVAAGVTFDTDHPDLACAVVGDYVAPQGYAYLLIANGRATLASVLFSEFNTAAERLERAVAVFRDSLHFEMTNPRSWGGYGAFRIPKTAMQGRSLLVGEAAGFQDFLFGFGIRSAMFSGHLAARSILAGENYDRLWQQRLLPSLLSTDADRRLYARLGNAAYYGLWLMLGFLPRPDLILRGLYYWKTRM
jgi:flavin-dependent dehydrogenase